MPASPTRAHVDELLKQLRDRIEKERDDAQDAIATLVRTQVAQGLAPLFLQQSRPYETNQQLTTLLEQGLLDRAAFIQKTPEMLQFYKQLLFALDCEPRRILEIGVKGGGSTVFWKTLFPSATVVGMDIKLRRWISSNGGDGVIYVEGDQSDTTQLEAVAGDHGPFDIVIDDGSHISDHQAITLRALLKHVRAGGVYVIEDVHASLKKPTAIRKADYGEDIWPDFVMTLFQKLRYGPASGDTAGARLALDVFSITEQLIVGERALAIRTRSPR